MKKTPLFDHHVKLGAKMVEFAGYSMPLQYSGLKSEHAAVRETVGLFDVSHMGEFFVEGPQATQLVQYLTSNDANALIDGKVQYSCLMNAQAGVVDDLLVYRFSNTKYMLVVNASNIDKDFSHIKAHNTFDCSLRNMSDQKSLLALQGPSSKALLQSLGLSDTDLTYYTFKETTISGVDVVLSATGYTGEKGFEIYVSDKDVTLLWEAILKAGVSFGIQPCGLAARDTLRLEMGFCLYGNELLESTSPLEASLGWITKLETDFLGRDVLAAQKEKGIPRRLSAFYLKEKGIARKGYVIVDAEDTTVGEITSGSMSPSLHKAIALGYVKKEALDDKRDLFVMIRSKKVGLEKTKLPFYQRK